MPTPSRRPLRDLLSASLALCLLPSLVGQGPPPGFTYEIVVPPGSGLSNATAMAFAPDGRLFLTERVTGRIRVVRDGVLQPSPWATLAVWSGGSWAEQGLLGIAIDPDFLQNRYVYVYYTDSGQENRIARLQEQNGVGTNLTVLSPNGAIPSIQYHNGGPLLFGRDGTLFVATGDGLFGANAQDPGEWRGKVLRFEVPNLTVPANNPFPGSPVYSLGHRNQFGLALHPVTGDLFQTENGGALMDEINRIEPGGNYGWPSVEGREVAPMPQFVDPLAWYQPTTAPTGCTFYAGNNYPPGYQNVFFFTCWNHGRVRAVTLDAAGQNVAAETIFHDQPGSGYAVTMGPDGNLWYLTNQFGGYGADEIGRYVHQNEPLPSLNVMATSNRCVGGSMTICVHGHTGGIAGTFLSLQRLQAPLPTPWGNAWILPDASLPAFVLWGDDRGYLAWQVANDPTLLDLEVQFQAVELSPAGVLTLTNPATFVLRG
ncbi:MAG: PQQ-dependent sugar dehydrogenase [Planctomycetes bacterium]|nr:PQQ-dependent sugar dehydrogenase [Planctomycetota bacterium]